MRQTKNKGNHTRRTKYGLIGNDMPLPDALYHHLTKTDSCSEAFLM